jgi:hypothetical protein
MGIFIENEGESEAAAYQAVNPAGQDEPTITPGMMGAAVIDGAGDNTPGNPVSGDANALPILSDTPQSSINTVFRRAQDFMGAIGTAVRGFGASAGALQQSVTDAGKTMAVAKTKPRGSLSVWWANSTGSEKLVAVAAVAALYSAAK